LLVVKFHVIQNIHSTSETIAGKNKPSHFLLKKINSRRDVFSGKRQPWYQHYSTILYQPARIVAKNISNELEMCQPYLSYWTSQSHL